MVKYGLTSEEVEISRGKDGTNKLTEQEVEGFWQKFIGNFSDPIIKILIVALVLNLIFAFMGKTEWYESMGIAIAVFLATFVATLSEYSNETTFQKLQEEASKITCKVYRDYEIKEIQIDEIVVGDCIVLQAGDKIPADGFLVSGHLKVDQAVMNGESKEASKITAPEGYTNKKEKIDFLCETDLFRGTVVCSGEAIMKVGIVGDNTVYGALAQEMQTEDRESPLTVKLKNLADGISKFGYIGGGAIAIGFLVKKIIIDHGFDMQKIMPYISDPMTIANDLIQAVILAVIIIVVAVPEGLPMMIAIVLSMNMKKMLNDNVLVRKLVGIETSGSLNILFSDKTGTITKGQLEVVSFIDGDNNDYSHMDELKHGLGKLANISILCNTTAVFSSDAEEKRAIGGNATERAFLEFAKKEHIDSFECQKVAVIPFDSAEKYSATQINGEITTTLVKGAPEKILRECKYYYDSDGNIAEMTNSKLEELNKKMDDLANRSIRLLALATTTNEIADDKLELNNFTLVGLMGIRDDIRKEAIEAIRDVQKAGVQVVMITGDRKETAVAIAKEAGLLTSDEHIVLTSDELNDLNDDEVKNILPKIRVIARALPTDKSRLVRVSQELNMVVGMTGDGVNDSPALKKADVGFAMGSGTEVAKEAGDIVILDDNFISIAKAILYGRTIFKSIRKFIIFQLTINVSAVAISFICPLIGVEYPLSVTQMLWVNLIMDTLAALAFGGEPALRKFMEEIPKRRDENILSPYMWSQILSCGIFVTLMSIFFLKSPSTMTHFRPDPSNAYLMTGFFSLFVFFSIFNAFGARTPEVNIFDNLSKNKGFIRVMAMIALIQVVITYVGREILRTYGLTINEWIYIIAIAFLIVPFDILRKIIYKGLNKSKATV